MILSMHNNMYKYTLTYIHRYRHAHGYCQFHFVSGILELFWLYCMISGWVLCINFWRLYFYCRYKFWQKSVHTNMPISPIWQKSRSSIVLSTTKCLFTDPNFLPHSYLKIILTSQKHWIIVFAMSKNCFKRNDNTKRPQELNITHFYSN